MRSVAEPQGRREHNRQQKSATIGTRPMERPTLVTRFFMRIVGWVEHLNLALSAVGNPTIYDKAIFPWAYLIESEWQTIRAELQRVLARKEDLPAFHELAADASAISNDHRWKSFVLTGYGFSSANNIRLCPEAWRICQSIPGLITVLFSILEPGKHLPAHRGPYNGVLRLHLGLIVPEPRERLGIRVESQIYRWREGEVVIFDDAYEHEAWNDTIRACLIRRFPKTAAFSCEFDQLAPPASGGVHAIHPRGHRQREGLGKEVLRGSGSTAEPIGLFAKPLLDLAVNRG